jgi:hypothetical protein
MIFNFALEYAIRKVQESQVGLKLNEKLHLLAYAHDVNLLGDNLDTINKNKTNKLVAFSQQANYTDLSTATGWRNE